MSLDVASVIEDQIAQPASVTEEGRSEAARTPEQLIKADQYLAQKAARKRGLRGIGITRLTTPGCLDDSCRPASGFDTGGY